MDRQINAGGKKDKLEEIRVQYPQKFVPEKDIFKNIHAGQDFYWFGLW